MRSTAAALAAVVLAAGWACDSGRAGSRAFPIPGERGSRITVEVLNASGRPGLARAGTRSLRRSGIDVVYFGNAPSQTGSLDSTRIVVRRGDVAAAERVRRALGVGQIVQEADPRRLLDVSVLLGADFSPDPELYP